jgi:hypothetical protein
MYLRFAKRRKRVFLYWRKRVMNERTFVLSSASGVTHKVFRVPSSEVDETEFWDLRAEVWRLYHQKLNEVPEQECGSLGDLKNHISAMNGE